MNFAYCLGEHTEISGTVSQEKPAKTSAALLEDQESDARIIGPISFWFSGEENMSSYFRVGMDFVLRCGGPGDIQWFKGENFEAAMQVSGSLPRSHPARMAFQAASTVSNLLNWWNFRKDNVLQVAQFEERRILWVIDILQQFYTELSRGEVKLDTLFFLERELSRYFQKSQESELNEFPSSLLLQIYRAAGLQASLNHCLMSLIDIIKAKSSLDSEICHALKADYKSFNKTNLDENSWVDIETLWRELATIEKISVISIPISPDLLAAEILRKDNMRTKRGREFSPISQLSFELLWTKNLAAILKSRGEVLFVYKKNQLNFEIIPEVFFPEERGPEGESQSLPAPA